MRSPAQQRVWRHNGLRGSVVMIQKILFSIIRAPTTTNNAKHFAELALEQVDLLEKCMKERVDP